MDLVRRRRSVRTFDGSALGAYEAEQLMSFARAADNPYGIPIEWKLLSAERYGLRAERRSLRAD